MNHSKKTCRSLKSELNTFEKYLDKKLDTFEKKLEEKANTVPDKVNKTWADIASRSLKSEDTTAPSKIKEIVKTAMVEHKKNVDDKENRESNLIIYRVPESEAANSEVRAEEDTEFFNNLCTEALGIDQLETTKVIRLGKKNTDSDVPRPMKVDMANKEDKSVVFGNINKMKDTEEEYRKISISNDYTVEERKAIKEKVEEAKTKTMQDDPKNWIYRVRGPPSNLRIEKIRK